MEIMVTGAAGTLAKHVIDQLRDAGHSVVACYFRDALELDNRERVTSYRVDITKRGFEDVFRNHKIRAVLHLGRITTTQDRLANRRYNANVMGTRKLLELCLKYGVGQVQILSTYFVYGASAYNPALLDEDSPLKASGQDSNLVDMVELENLAHIHMFKNPELHITILRPVNIVGPHTQNALSFQLSREAAPAIIGFNPMMQFVQVEDMADAVVLAFEINKPGIYNVAPEDWAGYQDALKMAGCGIIPVPSIPPGLTNWIADWSPRVGLKAFPRYMVPFMKYPVVLDGTRFTETFGWKPKYTIREALAYYRDKKQFKKAS